MYLCASKKKDVTEIFTLQRHASGKLPLPPRPVSEARLSENRQRFRTPPDTLHSQLPRPSRPTCLRSTKPLWTPICSDTGMSPSSKENPLLRQIHALANLRLLPSPRPLTPTPGGANTSTTWAAMQITRDENSLLASVCWPRRRAPLKGPS